jgi:Mrp family chromosome partitioning ATPase
MRKKGKKALEYGFMKKGILMDKANRAESPGDLERSQQDRQIESKLGKIKRKVLVMSGKGGVGKSTVAAYVALLLSQRGKKVGLLDVDLHGPSIPRMLGAEGGFETAGDDSVRPHTFSDNLGIVSIEMVLGDRDMAVIWRGPMKISAIRQFISDIDWGDLDFLIVDSPPGTGDEPLTVAQTIPDAEALIVTTPQEISLADVRKSINFCRQVDMNIIGIIENMSGMSCPHCGEKIPIFGKGGGAAISAQMGVKLIGEIPIDPEMVEMGDRGRLKDLSEDGNRQINKAYGDIVAALLKE